MLSLIRKHWLWFATSLALGIILRLFFIFKHPLIQGDSLLYGDIAVNWVRHGTYGFSELGEIRPTLVRLPGYPGFLALCFKLFGVEHYHAVMFVQAIADLLTAFVLAATARELLPTAESNFRDRATLAAFTLYCLFPYTANYVAAPLAETLTLFSLSLAMLLAIRAQNTQCTQEWILCGIASATTVLLRPDGGMVLISLFAYLAWRWWRNRPSLNFTSQLLPPVLILGICTVLALVPWTVRNYRTFHIFQPLAPANATDPGEFYEAGFTQWVGTWLVDFVSVQEVGWNVPGEQVDPTLLPNRAFDSAAQRQQTLDLFAQYNDTLRLTPALDAQFAALARERKSAHPFRYYVVLPLRRVIDMWLRPRTDLLPFDIYWWNYPDHPAETIFVSAYGALGIVFLLLAFRGYRIARYHGAHLLGVLTSYIFLRTLFLLTIPTAEQRYTIECWPMVLVLISFAFARSNRFFPRSSSIRPAD